MPSTIGLSKTRNTVANIHTLNIPGATISKAVEMLPNEEAQSKMTGVKYKPVQK